MIDPAPILHWRPTLSLGWLIALLVWENWRPCFALFGSSEERGRHGLRNVALSLINVLMVSLLFAGAWSGIAAWSANHSIGVLHWLPLGGFLHAVFALLALDFWTYAWHRICHQVPMLWKFHAVHHADRCMDVTTSNRFHMVEIFLSSLLRIPLIALVGVHFGELVLYETVLQVCVQWQHANIRIPADWEHRISAVLITPGLHKVHHSNLQPETDSNYSSLLSIWDRWMGTRCVREDLERIQFGIDGEPSPNPNAETLSGLIRRPFGAGPEVERAE